MILNEDLFENIELNEEIDKEDLYFNVLHFIDDLGYDSDIAKEFYQMDDVIDSLTRLLKRVEDYKKYESLKESKNLNEVYSARWDNMVTYSNPIKQQYADLVNDQIYDALDNIDILASSKISDLPEQTDFGFDQAERVSKAISNLVRTMTTEYFRFTDLKDESLEESLDSQTSNLLKKYAGEDKKTDKIYKWIGTGTLSLDLNPDDESVSRVSDRLKQDGFKLVDIFDGSTDADSYMIYTKTSGEDKYLAAILFYDDGATLQLEINPEDEDSLEYFNESLEESFTVELYKDRNKDPERKRFKDYKSAMKFAKDNANDFETIMITKPDASGPSVVNSYEKDSGWYTESLNEVKIADKIIAKQDTKEMTRRAIKMLKDLGGDYEDLAKEFKDAYGENPLEEAMEKPSRYSDHVPQEKRKYWYFTTHGAKPGSIPSDLHVLEIRDGENEKGTKGTFVMLDGVLNTSELNKFDMKELVPKD